MQICETDDNFDNKVLDIFKERCAILKGHFLLTSGLHSDTYIQCARLHEVPTVCEHVCSLLLQKVRNGKHELLDIDVVVSPAMGGIMFGYEIARQLESNFVFLERVNGCFTLRRGLTIEKNAKVLIVEDVITTGKSSLETYDVVVSLGGHVVGELSIVNRAQKLSMPFPTMSLLTLEIANYPEDKVPDHLSRIPITQPGSRQIK